MLKLFQRWARVKEVFISRRLNRWGRRFGFVRFFTVDNAVSLERDLDRYYIGNRKLYVNLPRYQRDGYERKRVEPKEFKGLRSGGDVHPNGQRKGKEVWREKSGKEGHMNGNVTQSYADVVRKRTQDQWRGPSLTTKALTLPWMTNSLVGRMTAELNFELLQEECFKGGMNMFMVRYLGDNLVLMTPKAEERIEDIVKLNNEWFECIFEDIKPWTASCVAGYKIVWVRCYGLPLPLWSKECLLKVVGEVATLVDVDEATLAWENLEYAWIRVRVLQSSKVEMSKGFRINGVVYNINIVEEVVSYGGVEPVCKCALNHDSSSDSVSSTETFVENTIFSVDSGNLEGGDEGGNWRRPKKIDRERSGGSTAGTKKAHENECSDCVEGCQKKRDLPVDGSTLSANQKISDAYALIKKSLANLVKVVGISSNLNSRSKLIEAHFRESCQQANLGNKGDCGSGVGAVAGHVWNMEASGNQPTARENTRYTFSATVSNKENNSIAMVEGDCKGVQKGNKEAFDQDGKEEEQEGTREVFGMADSQKRKDKSQTLLEGSVPRTQPLAEQVIEITEEIRMKTALNLPCSLAVEDTNLGSRCETPLRRRKMKGLHDLVESSTHLRRSVRLSEKSSQVRKGLLAREGSLSMPISDGDIRNCNSRLRNNEIREEPTKLWDQGKQIGLVCRGEEEEVIQEYQCMEDRDLEFMESIVGGNLNGFLC